jgi:hypothetical protein
MKTQQRVFFPIFELVACQQHKACLRFYIKYQVHAVTNLVETLRYKPEGREVADSNPD